MKPEYIPSCEELTRLLGMPISEEQREVICCWEASRESILAKSEEPIEEPYRWILPDTCKSITHRFEILEGKPLKCYLILQTYPSGRLGGVHLRMAKKGSFKSGVMNQLTRTLSIALQHGISLSNFMESFEFTRFDPAGLVSGVPEGVPKMAHSILDYVAKYIKWRCPDGIVRRLTK